MSQRHSQAASGSTPSWRDRSAARRRAGAPPLRPWRWLLSVLVLGMVGLLGWWGLRPFFGPGATRLVAMSITPADALAAPPLPFADGGMTRLMEVEASADVKARKIPSQKHADILPRLGTELANFSIGKRDILLLYVEAHVGVDGDGAYLACSDYDCSGDRGRHPLKTLFQTVAAAHGSAKLVVLNVQPIDYDPRNGIAANDLALVLAKELKALGRQELWVLLPCAPLERPAVSYPDRQSVLGLAVVEALEGKADFSQDGKLNLLELYGYVLWRCDQWYAGTSARKQTPLLMKAGVGLVDCGNEACGAEKRQLLTLQKPPPKTDAAEPKPEAEKPQASESAAKPGAITGRFLPTGVPYGFALLRPQTAIDESPRTSPAPPSAKPAVPPPPEETAKPQPPASKDAAAPPPPPKAPAADGRLPKIFRALKPVWLLRDQLEEPALNGLPSPIDFAPHQWRKLNALLLGLEQESLEAEATARASRPDTDSAPPGGDTDERPQELLRRLEDGRVLLQELRDAIRGGRGATLPPGGDQRLRATCEKVAAAWNEYRKALADLRLSHDAVDNVNAARRKWRALAYAAVDLVHGRAASTVVSLDSIDDLLRELEHTKGEPEETDLSKPQGTYESMLRTLSSTLSHDATRDALVRGEDLLRTPLLRAEERLAVWNALLTAKRPSGNRPEKLGSFPKGDLLTGTPPGLGERLTLLRLEFALLRLAGIQGAKVEVEGWGDLHKCGQALRTAYKELCQSGDSSALLLRDPRDSDEVQDAAERIPLVPLEREVHVLLVSPPEPIPLALGHAVEVVLLVRASWKEDLDKVTPECNATLLDVTAREPRGKVEFKNGLWEQEQVWLVTATRDAKAVPDRGPVTSVFSVKEIPDSAREVRLSLPEPDVVELALRDPSVAERPGGVLEVSVYPHSQRRTIPPLEVWNKSGPAKRLEINLYTVPPSPDPDVRPEPFDDRFLQKLRTNAELLKRLECVSTVRVEVNAGARKPLEFGPPLGNAVPAAKAAQPEAPGPAVAKETPAAGTPPARETRGLVCEIKTLPEGDKTLPKEAKPAGERWLKGLPLRLVNPLEYLRPAAAYDPGGMRFTLKLPPPAKFPPAPAVHLQLTAPDEPALLQGAKRTELLLPEGTPGGELFATVHPDGRKHLFGISIDGCPRALLYRVECDPRFPLAIERSRTERRIRVNGLEVTGKPVRYHLYPWSLLPDAEPDAAPDKTRHVKVGRDEKQGEEIVLAAPVQSLRVYLEVDVPDNAFTNPNDRIEAKLGTVTASRYASRMVRFYVHAGTDQTPVGLSAEVADWSLDLTPGIAGNLVETLQCRAHLSEKETSPDASVSLRIDADRPEIEQIELLRDGRVVPDGPNGCEVPKGTALKVRVAVRDFSGPAAVAVAVSPRGKLPAMPEGRAVQTKTDRDRSFEEDVDSQELKEGRYEIYVKVWDRVEHESAVQRVPLQVMPPPPPPPPASLGVIRVRVQGVGGARVRMPAAMIELPGGAQVPLAAVPGSDDTFESKQLPLAAVYTIKASGTISNQDRTGTLANVKPQPKSEVETIPIIVK